MKITLIRHTSVAVETGICYGWTDVDVSTSFPGEAKAVQNSLQEDHFDKVYSSPLLRCRKLAAFCGFPSPLLDDRLKELHFGRWEMQKWDDIHDPSIENWYQDWIHQPAGGGESYEHQYQRVAHFLDDLKQTDYRHVGIFTHRGVIACAMVYAGLCTLEDSFRTEVNYGSKNNIEL